MNGLKKRAALVLGFSLVSHIPLAVSQEAVDAAQKRPQWINANTSQSTDISTQSAAQQIQEAFPESNFGADSYATNATAPTAPTAPTASSVASEDGVAPMPPLTPPSNYEEAKQQLAPFTSSEVRGLRDSVEGMRQDKAYKPVRTIPRISSETLDLSPGAAIPVLRTAVGEMSTMLFVDSTGAPWPLAAAPRNSSSRFFDVEWLEGTPSVIVSALSAYETGNVTVFLEGLATPVVVKLVTGETDTNALTRVIDVRKDLRVPGRGPNAKASLMGPGKIALYDDVMQAFLDGIPPQDAELVTAAGDIPARTRVWQFNQALYVRTQQEIQSAFDQSMAAGDGTKVYRLPITPYVTLSDMGRSVTLQLDIK
ncbi:DotH/IcmK family type IV secretion protein [Stutzerimonas nitrititolerans]|uniref:DotH/IcmK family type IV secretion protein n=1 Tax=Stutzerimonas nitrititolerans TaxID=2482751 RepID=UPI0028ABF820|nr:DotH/IcmK family type IV secretion protein [Stutzerimonas nitrititolerans]